MHQAHETKATFAIAQLEAKAVQQLLTVEEAAEVLRVPASWLRHRVASHEVACIRLGRHIRFTRGQLAVLIETAVQPVLEAPQVGLTRRARRRN